MLLHTSTVVWDTMHICGIYVPTLRTADVSGRKPRLSSESLKTDRRLMQELKLCLLLGQDSAFARFGLPSARRKTRRLEDEKDFSECVFSPLETYPSVVMEKCVGETVYLLQ